MLGTRVVCVTILRCLLRIKDEVERPLIEEQVGLSTARKRVRVRAHAGGLKVRTQVARARHVSVREVDHFGQENVRVPLVDDRLAQQNAPPSRMVRRGVHHVSGVKEANDGLEVVATVCHVLHICEDTARLLRIPCAAYVGTRGTKLLRRICRSTYDRIVFATKDRSSM